MKFDGFPPRLVFEECLSPELEVIGREIMTVANECPTKDAFAIELRKNLVFNEDDIKLLLDAPLRDFEKTLKKIFEVQGQG